MDAQHPAAGYVHGYDEGEDARLRDQAGALADLLHHDTAYPPGARVLEAGSGTGAQTLQLLQRSPQAHFTCVDRSAESLSLARRRLHGHHEAGRVDFLQADLHQLPFAPASFDHVFVCFVLEHLPDPAHALSRLLHLLRPGGTVTVIEGDHGPTCFHPEDRSARAAIDCLVTLQRRNGGDPEVGRRLHPLLVQAGLREVTAGPRVVYVDGSRPDLADAFTRRTFTAMVAGVRAQAVAAGLSTAEAFDDGLRALARTAEPDGVFCYTFFKGRGVKAPPGRTG